MTYSPDLRDDLVGYLTRAGWEQPLKAGPVGSLWSHEGTQLKVPVPHEVTTQDVLWQDILRRIADVEGTTPEIVESQITLWSTDVTDLRAANDIVIADTIPFDAGVVMLHSAWQMYRACATTSWGPRMTINGNYRHLGDVSLSMARMAHTRRGSYVIPIYMPLGAPPQEQDHLLPETETAIPEPSERRVSRTFAQALTLVDEAVVQPEGMPQGSVIADLVGAGVSREFVVALAKVLTEPAVAAFSAEFKWARSFPAPTSLPRSVEISAAAGRKMQDVAAAMRHTKTPRAEIFSGPIIEVHHAPDDPLGSVVVQGVRKARTARVRVMVSTARVEQALELMRNHETVVVSGRIRREGNELRCAAKDAFLPLSESMLPGTA